MKEIATALVKAQKEFGPALKTSTNPYFRSQYADLGICVEAVIDAFNNNGIYLMQLTEDHPDGIKIQTVFIHESGEQMSSGWLFVPAAKADPQGFGSALTYARRYSLMTACALAPEDDDGNSAKASSPQVRAVSAVSKPALPPPPAPPAKIVGVEGQWQLKVSAAPETDIDDWSVIVSKAAVFALEMAQKSDDVTNIFKINRLIFDKLKILDPATYDMLMGKFKEFKEKLNVK